MYILNMVIILIVMYYNVVTAIDKIPTYLLRFNRDRREACRGAKGSSPVCEKQGRVPGNGTVAAPIREC